jgi:hypothetical protein
VLDVFD